jgi:SAM-dependent methyltransferase
VPAFQTADSPSPAATEFARDLLPGLFSVDAQPVSCRLFERMSEKDVAEIEERIRSDHVLARQYADAQGDAARRYLLLAFGSWLGAAPVLEKAKLGTSQPPEDVHAMARGPLAAAGGLYEGDLVIAALASAGVETNTVQAGLDFGCSSGRVVRVLAAAYPDIEWHGCDPNALAITWATENLPEINFFVSGDAPPLPLPNESLDLVYAISIWSHFAPELGLSWFDEVARLLHPGSHLVFTTHGLTSVAYYALGEHRTIEQSREIADALYTQGWWYAPEFGDEGDWGVVNPDWGTAFLSPEWLLTQLCPRWRVLEFAPGRNQDNQDVYVLERV